LQAGHPERQSFLMMINLTVSVALNLLLIPIFGLVGVAVATAIAFVCSSISVNLATYKWLGYQRGVQLY